MTDFTASCGCLRSTAMGQKAPDRCPVHGDRFVRVSSLRTPELVQGGEKKPNLDKPRRRSSLKRGKGLSASPEQQRKVKDLACIVCGKDRFEITITAMHVYPRRFAACSCADGVVSGCIGCHPLYEEKRIDLLGLLVAHDFRRELVHAVVEHHAPIFHVLEIVTGTAWMPVSPASEREAA